MSSITVSIIIPSYNYAHVLHRAIESALCQKNTNEVIIVDDGSTDNTENVITKFMQKDNRIHYLQQENSGPAVARNYGLKHATSDFVLLLDADDELLPGAIENLLKPLEMDTSLELIVGRSVSIDTKSGRYKSKKSQKFSTSKEKNFISFINKKISLSHGRFLAKRKLFFIINYPEQIKNAEDLSVYAHLFLYAKAYSIKEEVVIKYHHPDSFRHNSKNIINYGLNVVDAVFNPTIIPFGLMKYKTKYYSDRCLSMFRSLYVCGDKYHANIFYIKAILANPKSILKIDYLRKYIKSLLSKNRFKVSN